MRENKPSRPPGNSWNVFPYKPQTQKSCGVGGCNGESDP